jgi:hypothetical protein
VAAFVRGAQWQLWCKEHSGSFCARSTVAALVQGAQWQLWCEEHSGSFGARSKPLIPRLISLLGRSFDLFFQNCLGWRNLCEKLLILSMFARVLVLLYWRMTNQSYTGADDSVNSALVNSDNAFQTTHASSSHDLQTGHSVTTCQTV